MLLAVTIFNSGNYRFKTEVFAVLSNIAWTYLLHEYYERAHIPPLNADGTTFSVSFMLSRPDCPLSKGVKKNLLSLKTIRDDVEHKMLGSPDSAEGKTVQNILQKFKIADELYRYKPGDVVKIVRKATAKPFAMSDHTTAWQNHKVRPPKDTKTPDKSNRDYCIYHPAHRDYTYNDKWIALLIGELGGAKETLVSAVSKPE
jgi:uncharacterized protein DUF3644